MSGLLKVEVVTIYNLGFVILREVFGKRKRKDVWKSWTRVEAWHICFL